jgi:hypothetical protein
MTAWKGTEDEASDDITRIDGREVIQPGQRVRVSMLTMDSMQRQIAGQSDRTEQKAALDEMQRKADRTQAFADSFTGQAAPGGARGTR